MHTKATHQDDLRSASFDDLLRVAQVRLDVCNYLNIFGHLELGTQEYIRAPKFRHQSYGNSNLKDSQQRDYFRAGDGDRTRITSLENSDSSH